VDIVTIIQAIEGKRRGEFLNYIWNPITSQHLTAQIVSTWNSVQDSNCLTVVLKLQPERLQKHVFQGTAWVSFALSLSRAPSFTESKS
jgi:23S rRNA A2030 N6-methylase RlmJ